MTIIKGTELAREFAPEHADLIEAMLQQMLIVFLKRLGGRVTIPVAEIDSTGNDLFLFSVNDGVFHFEIGKKA